jgi:murein DD-endopeptidase MepM/ murein hydrolase activator NlpD
MYKVNGKPVVILPSYAPLFITAGYKNKAYYGAHKMVHYGEDFVSTKAFKVIAIGDGVITHVGIEPKPKNRDGLYGIVDLLLDPFYRPESGSVLPGVYEYFHMHEVYVRSGQRVKQGDVIGLCITAAEDPQNLYPGGRHLHGGAKSSSKYSITHPNYSPQVRNGKYVRSGPDTTVNPNTWFYIAPSQSLQIHPSATMASTNDLITRRVV